MDLTALTRSVASGCEMLPAEIPEVARALADPAVLPSGKEAFLEALARRGETAGEIAGFAEAFRGLARDPGLERWASVAIDVCGTGGDKSGSFNISTAVGFVLATAGIPVIKHGNRSITSHCGSADILEALGMRIDLEPAALHAAMEELNFVFLFAPAYHPAFKEIGPVRRALAARGHRSIFNMLGPLLNPARPAMQVMGIFAENLVPTVAGALDRLGLAGGLVVHGVGPEGRVFDELTVIGRNRVRGFGRLREVDVSLAATDVGLASGTPDDLAGGNAAANAAILDRVLAGQAPQGLLDSIVFNAAAGLYVAGRYSTIADAVPDARELLLGGAVAEWLARAKQFFHR
ncbi:MAG: anthranilate phosphoribosyltransferase [Opitutaceae bacterium]|nr:anthranilate phosphoribosyltransferase [Opitutaceae bacterium]